MSNDEAVLEGGGVNAIGDGFSNLTKGDAPEELFNRVNGLEGISDLGAPSDMTRETKLMLACGVSVYGVSCPGVITKGVISVAVELGRRIPGNPKASLRSTRKYFAERFVAALRRFKKKYMPITAPMTAALPSIPPTNFGVEVDRPEPLLFESLLFEV